MSNRTRMQPIKLKAISKTRCVLRIIRAMEIVAVARLSTFPMCVFHFIVWDDKYQPTHNQINYTVYEWPKLYVNHVN